MLLKIRICFKIPQIQRKILILLFVWLAQWPKKTLMITTDASLFPSNLMFLKIPICSSLLAQDDEASSFVISSFGHQGYGLKLKGGLESKDTHYFGLDSYIFRSCSSTIDSLQFRDKKKKFTIHLSLFIVTIHPLLFTPNFCLFKGGCPLCSKQVLVQIFFPRESSQL